MSSIKISQLPNLPSIAANTSNTLFLGVDIPTGTTGKFTATVLAEQLYANNSLLVGQNPILFSNTVGQLSGSDPTFLQVNMQNFNSNGSADFVITGDKGTNSNNYIDLGLNGSNFQTNSTVGNLFLPNDGYLYVNGPGQTNVGNLIMGTTTPGTKVYFIAGGANTTNVIGYLDASGAHFPSIDTEISANLVIAKAYTDSRITVSDSNAATLGATVQSIWNESNTALALATNISGNVTILQSQMSSNANSIIALTDEYNALYNVVNTLSVTSNTANLAIKTQAAYNQANASFNIANSSLQNTASIIIPGNVIINGSTTLNANTYYNGNTIQYGAVLTYGNLITFGAMTTTGNVITTGNLTATGPVTFNGQFINNGYTVNNGLTYLNGNTTTTGSFIMTNSTFASNSYAIGIIGSSSGQTQAPIADGTMLQITGKDNTNSKLIVDAAGPGVYALFNGRSMRGLANTPSALLSGDTIVRYGGNGYGTTGFGSGVGVGGAKIDYVAAENFTDTQKGTNIIIASTPVGSNALVTAVTIAGNNVTFANNVTVTNNLTVSANSIATNHITNNMMQYNATQNNANVTQLTNKTTGVTVNARTGQITTANSQINKGAQATFTVTNNYIVSSQDVVIVNISSGASVGYVVSVTAVSPGSFNICINNCDGTPSGSNASDTLVLNFAIIRVA